MEEFVKVGQVREFRKGRGRAVNLDGVVVAVFKTASGFLAVTDACPHMGASLADGRLVDENTLECEWHHWRYDTRTGQSTMRPWACVRVYEVKVQGEDVFLKRPPPPPPPPEPRDDDEEWMTWDPERFFRKKEP